MRTSVLAMLLLLAAPLGAQESRGTISGTVTDPQGAVIPDTRISITNTETNVTNHAVTNATGYFEVGFLNPGVYAVTSEAVGFRKSVRNGLLLQVSGRVNLDLQMQVGQLAETVEVTAAAPLLDTSTASGGRVINNQEVKELPFSNMNPFALTALAPGMQWTGQPEYRRPFDNSGTSSFNTMGNVGQNEYTMDGAPVTGTDRRVGFIPSSDAVEEFKLETTNFDASYGHTSGAIINVTTKAGTNSYHGAFFNQHWQQRWNATPHFTRLQFDDAVRQGKKSPNDQKQASGRSNQFGATLGGPVRIPRIYNGKNKLFFMFHYDGLYQAGIETTNLTNRTVPKVPWRQGDFSDLLALDATKYTIYDPRSAQLVGSRVTRTPFPGNKGIPVLNPMYKTYSPLYPIPNFVPGLATPDGVNDYYGGAMPKNDDFNEIINRFDYTISERHRISGRWFYNHRFPDEYDWTFETQRGLNTNNTLSLERINKGGGGNYVWTINSGNNLDVSLNVSRYAQGGHNSVLTGYKASDVGLPKYMDAESGNFSMLPQINISGMDSMGNAYPSIGGIGTTGEARVQMSSIRGKHSLQYGYQERRYWYNLSFAGTTAGVFSFDNNYMKQADDTTTASQLGLSWASFMMGLPSSINIARNDSAYLSTRYRALYLQDNWRLTRKLALNLGLRYERETGSTERFNRGLAGGFDFDYRPPFAAAAEAAYAKNPVPELGASQFKVAGGSLYLGQPNPNYTDGTHHLLPKISAVYSVNSKTVVRAGYGWYFDTYNVNNDRPNQDGYTRTTSTTVTNDRGMTFCCGLGAASGLSASNNPLVDPFPVRADGTRFDAAYGNSLGQMIRQGKGWTFVPRNYSPAWQQRWRVSMQREIRRDMVLEVAYNGAQARMPLAQNVSFLPGQYWASGNTRNAAIDNNLNASVANPFNVANFTDLQTSNPSLYKYLTTQSFFTATTIRKNQLLRPYPNLNGLTGLRPGVDFSAARGNNRYHDVEISIEKRMSRGLSTAVIYTRSYQRVRDYYANQFDTEPSWRPGVDSRPHRLVWQAIYELPFGKGRTWLTKGPVQHLLGGWQLSWIYQYQSGPPTSWGNYFYYGDPGQIAGLLNHDAVHSGDIHQWFSPAAAYRTGSAAIPADFTGFEGRAAFQPGTFQTRVFPTRVDALREDGIRNWDAKIQRSFRMAEHARTSFSVDLLNATNHTNFEGPNTDPTSTNFGRVTTQRGLSRVIQFNLRVEF